MGNLQQRCRGVTPNRLELDRPEGIYTTNEIISGTVSNFLKQSNACVLLTGIIYFTKRKKNGLEKCKITFYSTEFNFNSLSNKKQTFQLHLDNDLPPSFSHIDNTPNITYSINLIYKKSQDEIYSSIPIRICPRVQIDRPLLLKPLFFGPIDNITSGIKIEMKLNRAAFTLDDIIQIYYELQNPNQELIYKIQVSLGVYYLIESNVWQEDLCNGISNSDQISSNSILIRNKVLLSIPNKIYLPPTFKFQYGRGNDQSSFNLTIDYKIQFQIYLGDAENLWQVDVPIVLCNTSLDLMEIKNEINFEGNDTVESPRSLQSFELNVNNIE